MLRMRVFCSLVWAVLQVNAPKPSWTHLPTRWESDLRFGVFHSSLGCWCLANGLLGVCQVTDKQTPLQLAPFVGRAVRLRRDSNPERWLHLLQTVLSVMLAWQYIKKVSAEQALAGSSSQCFDQLKLQSAASPYLFTGRISRQQTNWTEFSFMCWYWSRNALVVVTCQ